ncbi:MAG: HPr kinase/phosphatase C-terminal domain-containing protein [Alphaproteobacteria bacterium]|nr:HPr kinase/phosphatase C-terminal domain-containing protein [Alphaproteobacteria bacterium]MBN9591994.1 HPr kinase/phosphatase C-terminal domain-containing protein [Alphaproteobacteria bacterium]
MTETVNIHASCVSLDDAGKAFGAVRNCGILILGESGAGKSTLVLQLLAAGATLVADDRTELFVKTHALQARAPRNLRGLLEIRGAGIVKFSFRASVRVAMVVRLTAKKPPRMPERTFYAPPGGLSRAAPVPLLAMKSNDIAAAAKLAAAASAFANNGFLDNAP